MQWIRENLFLTCLVSGLIVCCAVGVFMRMSQDSAFREEDMKPRATMARKLGNIGGSKPLNEKWINDAKANLERIKKQRDGVVKDTVTWNKKKYKVLQLTVDTKTLDAFPYDPAVYLKQALTLKFTTEYRRTLYAELAKLDLTTWPTAPEIDALAETLEKAIKSKRKAAQSRVEYSTRREGAAPSKTAPEKPDEEAPEEKKPDGVSQEDWDDSRLTDAQVSEKAKQAATEQLTLKKAEAGAVYVSPKTLATVSDPNAPGGAAGPEELDVIFPQEVWKMADAPAAKLWQAQINLWLTQEIIAAIDATNQQSLALRGGGARSATVPNVAVKRLLGIDIEEEYIGSGAEKGLTGRSTTTGYELVDYEFTVIINTRYLRALARNLMKRGDHTITDVIVAHAPAGVEGTRYYGVAPVAKVLVAAEALFRSDWTRPKLMPTDTLRTSLSGVLRPEDQKRLEE